VKRFEIGKIATAENFEEGAYMQPTLLTNLEENILRRIIRSSGFFCVK
jgi:endonuclease III-like uncharacterized protein